MINNGYLYLLVWAFVIATAWFFGSSAGIILADRRMPWKRLALGVVSLVIFAAVFGEIPEPRTSSGSFYALTLIVALIMDMTVITPLYRRKRWKWAMALSAMWAITLFVALGMYLTDQTNFNPSVAKVSATATTDQPNWRADMMAKYLRHEILKKNEAWWLDVSPGLASGPEYLEVFANNGYPEARTMPYAEFWHKVMYPVLYENYSIQLPPTATAEPAQ